MRHVRVMRWIRRLSVVVLLLWSGYAGVNCQEDIDECATRLVSCGEGGTCINTPGSFICKCPPGSCGPTCDITDPCFETRLVTILPSDPAYTSDAETSEATAATGRSLGGNGTTNKVSSRWVRGPCQNDGVCKEMCSDVPAYECQCVEGWAGKNCTDKLQIANADDGVPIGIIIGCVVGGLCALGGAGLAAACVLARTKRATRGTYSPSGQEYRNPRLEMLDSVLKPPPEERLI